MTVSIDPKLKSALESSQERLNVFAKIKASPAERSAIAQALIKRVTQKTHESPRFHFRDLDSILQVSANRSFIAELLRQPEVDSASMVPDLGSPLIEPVKRRDVSESEIAQPTFPRRHISRKGR